jgi:RND superfamily putative drug exporter
LAGLARWCFHHRLIVVLVWIAALVGLVAAERIGGTAYSTSFSLPGTESTQALKLLMASLPKQAGDSATIVWHVTTGTVREPATQARVSAMLAKVAAAPEVASVRSPYAVTGAAQISRDGQTAFATVGFTKLGQNLAPADIKRVVQLAERARTAHLQVELGGNPIEEISRTPPSNSEAIGVLAAGLIILIAFGSLLGMAIPLATAVMALGSGVVSIGLLSHLIAIPSMAPILAALIGLGVGIDYALFIVTRHRDGLKSGLTPEEAAVRALDTSGRAVLFAGGTVCIALLGLLVLRMDFLNGMAIAAAMTVVFTMAGAITLLPALLGFIGLRVLSRRERRRLTTHGLGDGHDSSWWAQWATFVSRRAVLLAIGAAVFMIVLASPVLTLRLGSSDAANDPAHTTTRKAYDLLAKAFGPGSNGPLLLVAQMGGPADQAALSGLTRSLASVADVAAVVPMPSPPGAKVAIVQVFPQTSPQDVKTSVLITHLRKETIPQTVRGSTLKVYVGGTTAIYDDFATVLTGKLPLFIGVIVGLGFLLLLVAFRSVLVPATAAIMNLLAAGASFGVVVVIFQKGWLSEPLGLGRAGPVESFLPVIMLAILFGLSMDYQVFLVSRMHEEWVHGGDNERAIRVGQATTGRVITAAAAIMISVFIAFAFGGQRVIAEFGIGLAAAVFLDAVILRTVLVPSMMHLFGTANWWLPKGLDRRLPHLSVEPVEVVEPVGMVEPVGAVEAHEHPAKPGKMIEPQEAEL